MDAAWHALSVAARREAENLVQEITRQRLPDNEKNDALYAAFDLLSARLPSPDWDEKGWQLWEQLAPHCRALLDHLM